MRKLLLSSALLLGIVSPALSQSFQPGYTGLETVKGTTLQGSIADIPMNQIRNSSGYLLVPTGGTVTTTPTWNNSYVLATGAITTWTVNLPNPAPDGMLFAVGNSTAAAFTTNTTVQTQAGSQTQTLTVAYASQTLAAGSSAQWVFSLTGATTGVWTRIR